MNAAGQRFGSLRIERAETREAAERRLDMAAGAAETVIEVEMTKGGVQIVAPHQADDAAAEPDAFRIAGPSIDRLCGFGEFIDLALIVARGVRRGGRALLGLILRPDIAALRESNAMSRQQKTETQQGRRHTQRN